MSVNDRIAQQIKRYTKITPTNATGSGIFSFKNGNPIIRFTIAEADAFLLAPETRFQFKLKAFNGTTGRCITQEDAMNLDPKVMADSVIHQLTISSRRYATSIAEQILNYNQLVSIAHPALSSTRDYATQRSHESMAVGKGILNRKELNQDNKKRRDNNSNVASLQHKYIACGNNAGPVITANNFGWDNSVPLYCGMFMSENLDLRLLGGLELEITLSADQAIFNNSDANTYYELSECVLNAPILYKSAQQMSQSMGATSFDFLSFTSLYNVIQSTSATITNKVGLRGALSMVQKFVPVSYLNNPAQKGLASWNVGVKRLTFHRNGQRFPLEYSVETERGTGTPQNEVIKEKNPQVLVNSLSAFENYKDVKHSTITSQNLADVSDNFYFMGVSFDQVSGQGIDLSGGTISTEVDSTLQNQTFDANGESTSVSVIPYGVFTFFLNKETLMIQPNQRITAIE